MWNCEKATGIIAAATIFVVMLMYCVETYYARDYIRLQQRVNELELRESLRKSGIQVKIPGYFEGIVPIQPLPDSENSYKSFELGENHVL